MPRKNFRWRHLEELPRRRELEKHGQGKLSIKIMLHRSASNAKSQIRSGAVLREKKTYFMARQAFINSYLMCSTFHAACL
jgi:hypothetical protein